MSPTITHEVVGLPPLAERTLTRVLAAQLARDPDKIAVHDLEGSRSYGALHDEALGFAAGLIGLQVGANEPVLLMLDNHLDAVLAWWAVTLSGRVEVPVNTAYKGSILAHVINNSGARVMLVEAAYLPRITEIADRLQQLEHLVVRGTPAGTMPPKLALRPWQSMPGPAPRPAELQPWDLIGIMYTSGTTGPSKGVRVTHAHAYGYASPAVLGRALPHDASMVALPLFHIGGQWAGVYNSLIAGGTSVVVPRFSASTWWDEVRRFGCTHTLMLGAMANFLFQQPARADDAQQPMTHCLMVPVMAQLEAFQRRFGIATVGTAYGLTEGSTVLIAGAGRARAGAVGVPRSDFAVRLVDEHDVEVPPGKVGELLIRPDEPWSVMDGYHAMPEATVGAWRNQWLHTGDAFKVDADGQYVFVDRMKDAMRRRGENVSSFEVEREIMEYPAVLEAAVVAVPSAATEDDILACVVPRPGQRIAPAELLAFLDLRLPYFMVPRYVDVMDELPKTPTEKIRKQALRERGVTAGCYDRPLPAPPKGAR